MNTDKIPTKARLKEEYWRSDALCVLKLPEAEPVRLFARQIEDALAREDGKALQMAANGLSAAVAADWNVPVPVVRILGKRPKKVTETSVTELFGDYDPETARIRLWMRTAVLKRPTSIGTFLSTLCHELCHHLDVASLGLPETFHTRGFYERAALLYHHVRATPLRTLVWTENPDGTFRINWAETMRGNAGGGGSRARTRY